MDGSAPEDKGKTSDGHAAAVFHSSRPLKIDMPEPVEVVALTGAVVVENPDFRRAVLIMPGEVGADESRPDGDEDFVDDSRTLTKRRSALASGSNNPVPSHSDWKK
jgi:hypothetical protein